MSVIEIQSRLITFIKYQRASINPVELLPAHHMQSTTDRQSTETGQASREHSAAASEYVRKAREQEERLSELRARRMALLEQQAALEEEERLAEENLRSYSRQADSERQQHVARRKLYLEKVGEKHKQFRTQLAGEVLCRIGKSLVDSLGETGLATLHNVAAGSDHPNDHIFVEHLLLHGLVGDNGGFIKICAAKILEAAAQELTDADLAELEQSKICFHPFPQVHEVFTDTIVAKRGADPLKVDSKHHNASPIDPVSEGRTDDGPFDGTVEDDTMTDTPVAGHSSEPREVENFKHIVIKQEQNEDEDGVSQEEAARRVSMEQIDREPATEQSRQTSTADLLRSITAHASDEEERTSSVRVEVLGPAVSNKRNIVEEYSDEEMEDDTRSQTATFSQTSKRQRSDPKKSGSVSQTAVKFTKYINDQVKGKKLSSKDFACSHCSKGANQVDKFLMTQKCRHLYCFGCIKTVRQRQGTSGKGNSPSKTACVHAGCKSLTGNLSTVAGKDVYQLKLDNHDSLYETDERGSSMSDDTEISDSDD